MGYRWRRPRWHGSRPGWGRGCRARPPGRLGPYLRSVRSALPSQPPGIRSTAAAPFRAQRATAPRWIAGSPQRRVGYRSGRVWRSWRVPPAPTMSANTPLRTPYGRWKPKRWSSPSAPRDMRPRSAELIPAGADYPGYPYSESSPSCSGSTSVSSEIELSLFAVCSNSCSLST